ncbi:MAG TPA: hypothetical protein VM870_01060 [Pyrinomonadaceae bacterium]|jgi:hypothetical protein|nr:hypothetical protein [Pyrinomonadaceae bacterium]
MPTKTVPFNFRLLCRLAIGVLCLLATLNLDAAAQSGRRSTKQEPPPSPVQTAPVEPAPPRPASKPAAPTMPLIVGFNRMSSSFDMTPTYVQEYVYEACVARLRKSGAISLSPGGDMSRKEAVDRAKLQKDAYVVWFEVAVNSYERGATDASLRGGDSRLFIDYYVFTPTTSKVKKFGRVYLDQLRAGQGRVGVSIPSVTGRLPIQYRLQIAGEEVADRVLNEFHIPLPN